MVGTAGFPASSGVPAFIAFGSTGTERVASGVVRLAQIRCTDPVAAPLNLGVAMAWDLEVLDGRSVPQSGCAFRRRRRNWRCIADSPLAVKSAAQTPRPDLALHAY